MRLNRRQLLKIGTLAGGVGPWSLARLARAEATQPKSELPVRAKAVIFLHQWGGPSHHDTFDMKPEAPAEIRGQWKPISSNVPEMPVCELLPDMARVMDKVSQIRTLHHTMRNHNAAGYYSLSGHAPLVDDQRLRDTPDLFPAYGSVVDHLAPSTAGMPTFVSYPHVIRDGSVTPGQQSSFLGKRHAPLFIGQDPNDANFQLPELSLPEGLSLERLQNRREIQQMIDGQLRVQEYSTEAQGLDLAHQRALSMLASPRIRQAFNLAEEPAALRDRYGRTTYGQGCLLARRLVEAGARFINVYFSRSIGGDQGGWDTHDTNFPKMKNFHLPLTNQVLPVLLEDLEDRGLLDQTLVVWAGEFGRTPRINEKAGRDHWPKCYTALLAGGGVKRGYVHGASDKDGAAPRRDPVRPDDLAATMYYLLGIDPGTEVYDTLNRPLPIAAGMPVMPIIA
jgi:hypothetical protein